MTPDQHIAAFDWLADHIEALHTYDLDDVKGMLEQVAVR